MAGAYTGLQARVKSINNPAHFVPCAAHSLNLVGTPAAESCFNAVVFFKFLRELYIFSASTQAKLYPKKALWSRVCQLLAGVLGLMKLNQG
jgi:hypothetical protein